MPKRKRKESSSEDNDSDYEQKRVSDSESETVEVIPRTTRSRKKLVIETPSDTDDPPADSTQAGTQTASKEQVSPRKLAEIMADLDKETHSEQSATAATSSLKASKSTSMITPQSSPSRRGGTKSVSVSPKKARKEFSKPEAEWRRSDIPLDVEVTKGNAQKLFKLSADDISNSRLPFATKKRGTLKGEMHLYKMRDIERLAWRKFGSPEGFEAVLQSKKEAWIRAGKDANAFLRPPRPYTDYVSRKCKQCNVLFQSSSNLCDEKCDPCSGVVRKPYIPRSNYYSSMSMLDDFDVGYDREPPEDYDDEPSGYNPDYMTFGEYMWLRKQGKIADFEDY